MIPARIWDLPGKRRAVRFPVSSVLRFRRLDEENWTEANIENVSRTGVLFRAARILPLNTAVELRFCLATESAATVHCRGPIVRYAMSVEDETLHAVAIEEYRITRDAAADAVGS